MTNTTRGVRAPSLPARSLPALSLLVLLVIVLAGGCSGGGQRLVTGDGAGNGAGDGSGTPARRAGGGEDGLFVSVEVGGGFMPVGAAFRMVPSAAIYDDGTTLSPGATIAIYPGPAVLPVTEGRIDDEQLRRLVEAADAAGLIDGVDQGFGEPPVADAATTTVTVVVDGEVHSTSVYALQGADERIFGVDEAQSRARQEVRRFVDLVSATVTDAEGSAYVPDRYRLLPLPAEPAIDEVVEPDERRWPFPDVPLVEGECTALAGQQAVELRDALEDATEITRWSTDAGQTYVLAVRPVLPHEPDCPPQ